MKKRLNYFALLFYFMFFNSTILAQATLTFEGQSFGTQTWTENGINWTSGTWANIRTDYLGVSDGDYIQANHNLNITTLFILIDDMDDNNSYVDFTGFDSDDNIIQSQRFNSSEFMFGYEQINLTGFANIYKLKFEFDDLSGFGMVSVSIDDIGYTDLGILPVELISFTANNTDEGIMLNWSTATETNNYGFEIERKVGSGQSSVGNYEKIGFINGSGNSNSTKSYSYEDKNVLAGNYSYRLKQIDSDGKFEYSNTVEVSFMKPNEFSLEQNYPNPFNPTTKISWQSPVSSHQSLKVYDVLGNEVATLVNEFVEAGNHQIEFNAEGLSSGIYYYRFTSGAFTQTMKFVLMK